MADITAMADIAAEEELALTIKLDNLAGTTLQKFLIILLIKTIIHGSLIIMLSKTI